MAAFDAMFDGGWIGKLVALTAVISGIGALNGWTMVTAEMPYAAAKDGLFLDAFARTNTRGVPWVGIIGSTAVASALMAWSYSGETGLKVFTYLVYLSVVTVAIPYFISACAQLTYLVSRRRAVHGWALARDLDDHGRRCELLALGDLRLRLPVGVPGDAPDAARPPALRLPEGPSGAARPGR